MDASLWVIDPSLARAEDQGVEEVCRGWDGQARLFQPALRPGDGPEPATGYDVDAVVLLGSAASVHDDLPWLGPLREWVRPIVEGQREIPLLGVCFGHQLVAHVAGALVGFLDRDRTKRLGIETSRLDGGRLLPGRHDLRVVVSHREAVTSTPPGFREVATRLPGAVEALEHETLPVFSFQFHPEAREEFARAAGLDDGAIDDRVREDGRRLLDRFRSLVQDRRTA